MISSDIRQIDNGKRFVRIFGNFILHNGVNICSANLDRETTFLTLAQGQSQRQGLHDVADKLRVTGIERKQKAKFLSSSTIESLIIVSMDALDARFETDSTVSFSNDSDYYASSS